MFKNDYNLGNLNEIKLLKTFQTFFNDSEIETLDTFNAFDYKGNKKVIELKTRTCEHTTYNTTMIGANKIEQARVYNKMNFDVYFIFNFIDGIYYWKFTPENKLVKQKGGRVDRGKNEIKDYYYIPITNLSKLVI